MRRVKDCEPVGYTMLVEMLSSQEALGTHLDIGDAKAPGAPQAYIRKIGPFVEHAEKPFNFKVGDRVLLSGNYTPLPELEGQKDKIFGIIEPHAVKAVLEEGEEVPNLAMPEKSEIIV